MADGSTIEWLNRPGTKPATWNPVRGCTRVSEGCVNCYAETMAARFSDPGMWGHGFAETVKKPDGTSVRRWTGKVELIEEKLLEPLHWREPRTIFVDSISDLFHEKLPDAAIDRVFAVMAMCPQHTFIALTKRPERMRAYFAARRDGDPWAEAADYVADLLGMEDHPFVLEPRDMPLPNLWLGTSCEDQPTADERIPHLLATPAAVRFVSAEPMLGPIDFLDIPWPKDRPTFPETDDITDGRSALHVIEGVKLDWIITGGESGPNARPMHPAWARSIRDQCQAAGVPFFFKQWGAYAPFDQNGWQGYGEWMIMDREGELDIPDDRWPDEEAGEVAVVNVGKAAAGRLLDGRKWNEFPEAGRNSGRGG